MTHTPHGYLNARSWTGPDSRSVDIAWKRKAVCFFHGKTQFRVGRDARFVLLKDLYMS